MYDLLAAPGGPAGGPAAVVVFYIASLLATSWALVNVVLAVMLEEFRAAGAAQRFGRAAAALRTEDDEAGRAAPAARPAQGAPGAADGYCLGRLLEGLASVGSHAELGGRVDALWAEATGGGGRGGRARYAGLCVALRRYGVALPLGEWARMVRDARRVARDEAAAAARRGLGGAGGGGANLKAAGGLDAARTGGVSDSELAGSAPRDWTLGWSEFAQAFSPHLPGPGNPHLPACRFSTKTGASAQESL